MHGIYRSGELENGIQKMSHMHLKIVPIAEKSVLTIDQPPNIAKHQMNPAVAMIPRKIETKLNERTCAVTQESSTPKIRSTAAIGTARMHINTYIPIIQSPNVKIGCMNHSVDWVFMDIIVTHLARGRYRLLHAFSR